MALGIFSFALVSILGLLPVGLQTAQQAYRQNDATAVLGSAAAAIRGMRYDADGSDSNPTYAFGDWLSDSSDPQSNPTLIWLGQGDWDYTFDVLDSGAIKPKSGNPPAGTAVAGKLHIAVEPPDSTQDVVRVVLSYAWPPAPTVTWQGDKWTGKWQNAAGSETVVIYSKLPSTQSSWTAN
jgi:hypothetical protein